MSSVRKISRIIRPA
ncbi:MULTISPECIES: hypothetical protein [Caulobacter]|nr:MULTISPECIES: hypothetical protein [Caulobacter]MCA0357104.1 hypothetical protein [Pseudomonadota bacterium]UAL13107.1 hypothetical protein K8940_19860 [Caulobacter segnis]HJV42536.1 hypothetical protein [Caulobacter sp.]HWT50646.1 hypothetical protein [Caulobacter sp.]HWU79122.1 hypothetical protein [Caulobacter sp.]